LSRNTNLKSDTNPNPNPNANPINVYSIHKNERQIKATMHQLSDEM